jgi:hypothetical protein
MWNFQSKRNPLRDRLLLAAPEANPHEFVRRYLSANPRTSLTRALQRQEPTGQAHERRKANRRLVDPQPVPATI